MLQAEKELDAGPEPKAREAQQEEDEVVLVLDAVWWSALPCIMTVFRTAS